MAPKNTTVPVGSIDAVMGEQAPRARVLVVDDDKRNLLAISTVLEDLADIQTASSGDEALRHLLKGEFAVILLDVYMPGMDGYETAQIIRAREQTKRMPIVFLSAVNKEKQHLMRGYALGAVDYVFKPVESVVLRSKVAVFVDLFEMNQEIQRKASQEQQLLTERRELESQLFESHKMDAIGQLTGGIAHDFNNLLAAVLGGLGLLERRLELADDHKKIIDMTRRAAEQGSELVTRLLAFARRQQLCPTEIDLVELSSNVSELLEHTLGGLVELEWESAGAIPPAYADQNQLELALMNLIINARDAMPKGGTIRVGQRLATVTSENTLALPQGDYVVLWVEDRGTGIPDDLLVKVTEPFFTTKDVGKGTGLGLSMVYGFARQSNGAMDIRSVVGEGTTVEIWVPKAPQTPADTTAGIVDSSADRSVTDATEAQMRSLRVLLVDDHDAVRETTAGMLSDLGHSVDTACDGATMLKKFKAAPADYDLVVTDYAMPLMSGAEMLERARSVRPDIASIIISGYADGETIVSDAGDIAILHKPFTLAQMREAISREMSN